MLATRLRAARTTDNEMLGLYWRVGKLIVCRQDRQGWGSNVVAACSVRAATRQWSGTPWGASTAAMAVSTVSYENLPAAERAALPPAELKEAVALSAAAEDLMPATADSD